MNNLLAKIREGMKVYDQNQSELGVVDYVQLGDEDPLRSITENGTLESGWLGQSPVDDAASVFVEDHVPDTWKSRLMLYGFVRVNSDALFNEDRYIFPNQIDSVNGERITLKLTRNELLQRL